MNLIRQYLKQKVARSFGGRKVDTDVLKKEIRDELTHVLYDQTRRTPIVIPVINEISAGGGGGQQGGGQQRRPVRQQGQAPARAGAPAPGQPVRPPREGDVIVQQAPAIPEVKNQPFAQEEQNKHIREI